MSDSLNLLTNAFEKLKKYKGETFVIKCNGFLLEESDLLNAFAKDITSLKNAGINVIIVHDGTNLVDVMMEKFSLNGSSVNYNCPDQATVEIVEMILSGYVNKKIVSQINLAGGNAVGISGKDCNFMTAKRSTIASYNYSASNKVLNFGFLGELALMNPDILLSLEDSEIIPVISPIALGEDRRTYKIDVNDIAGAIAAIISAAKLIIISDTPGITDAKGNILSEVSIETVNKMVKTSPKNDNLSDKIRAIVMAFEQNTEEAHIINGKIPHALILSLFTDNIVGTIIK